MTPTSLITRRQFTAAVNLKKVPLPPGFRDEVPLDLLPLLDADRLTATVEFGTDATVALRVAFPTADAATAGEKALRKAADVGRQMLAEPRREAEMMLRGRKKGAGPRPLDDQARSGRPLQRGSLSNRHDS